MNRLPPENLQKVFILLTFQQQFQCMRVCRSWRNALDRYCLFYSVEVQKENDQFTRLMDMFERSPYCAACVKKLFISLKSQSSFSKRTLVNIFPNATLMKMVPDVFSSQTRHTHFTQDMDFTNSSSKLEYLSDFFHCELATQLVYSNLGDRLEALCLMFGDKAIRQLS